MTVRALGAFAALLLTASCAQPKAAVPAVGQPPPAPASAAPGAALTQQPGLLPPYYIESLRARPYPGGPLQVGRSLQRGAGFSTYEVRWPSEGQTMTGTIAIPDGNGPFPVVIVNHGFIPVNRYWPGADSGIYGDAMAAHGFIAVAPNYPGYAGSELPPAEMPRMVATAVAVINLVSSLATVPQADRSRIAIAGHSFGGGVSLIVMVVDPRIKAVALYGPVSSDMRDSARKWWIPSGSQGPLGDPDVGPEGYAHISPRNYFDAAQAPVLIQQGTLDEDIPADWTTATVRALLASEIKTQLTWFPGAYHNFVGRDLARANANAEALDPGGVCGASAAGAASPGSAGVATAATRPPLTATSP